MKRTSLETAEIPGPRAFGYVGIQKAVEARTGFQAATIAAEDQSVAKRFQKYFQNQGPDRWRALGCGKPMPSEESYPETEGLYSIRVIERRFFFLKNGKVRENESYRIRFAHDVNLKQPASSNDKS
jgi:hypothetical protein